MYFFHFNIIFKGYFPFTVTIKYQLYSPCCTITPLNLSYTQYFVPHTSHLYLALPPTVNHSFVLYISEYH